MESQKISIELAVAEWNVVIQSLAKMPYDIVANLIPAIQSQANAALKPAEQPAE
jgi:hypothetical protein